MTQSPSRERIELGMRSPRPSEPLSPEPKDTNLRRSPKAVHRRDGTDREFVRGSLLTRIAAASLRIWPTPSRFGKNPPIRTTLQDKNRTIVANKPPIRLIYARERGCTSPIRSSNRKKPNPKMLQIYSSSAINPRLNLKSLLEKNSNAPDIDLKLKLSVLLTSTIFCCNGTGTCLVVTRRFFSRAF